MHATEAEIDNYVDRLAARLDGPDGQRILDAFYNRVCELMDAAQLEPEIEYERRLR
jgi:hypothetical protein